MGSEMFYKIDKCRVCGNTELTTVLDLGNQYLSGIFPKVIDENMYKGPLKLVKCNDESGCGHVQLEHTFDLPTMYGQEYGYRSGLNASMVKHLAEKNKKICDIVDLKPNDVVVDIAGNDGTFLGFYPSYVTTTNIDPTADKFSDFSPSTVNNIVASFFSESTYRLFHPDSDAKVVTSFSMFYDLEDPIDFATQVRNILDPEEGIWVLEQSYMPSMVKVNSFDTVCHEHLSYYGMKQIKYIMDAAGLKIIDFEFNDVNGGSFSIVVANKESSKFNEDSFRVNSLIEEEFQLGFTTTGPWDVLQQNILSCKEKFWNIIDDFKSKGLKVAALGASTKGNVTLQTWEVGPDAIGVVGDVNPDKDGSFTPGTWIPITNEDTVLENYDVFVILPWHFKKFFIKNPKFVGKTLVFPLPYPEVVEL